MKKLLSYLLLISYTIILVKPLLPYVLDFVSHAFNKYEHIATVHKEHGKMHLHYELKKVADESNNSKTSIPFKVASNEVTPHLLINIAYNLETEALTQNYFRSTVCYPIAISVAGNYPPPKASYFY